MKWKQEETRRATEHGDTHTYTHTRTQRRKEVSRLKTQRENDWDKKGEMIFECMTTRKNDIQTPEENFFKKTTKTKLIALKKSYHECGLLWINEH
jgi:hypothetical protein